ncbi:MAG: hypothetical protein M9894_20220 [Planctomycetes bacterium]|nr:hypothetical protein [Planctomycetota bacterium]
MEREGEGVFGRAGVVHLGVRTGGAMLGGAVALVICRAVSDYPYTGTTLETALLGAFLGALTGVPVAAERWRLRRGPSRALDAAVAGGVAVVLLPAFVPATAQAVYGAGVLEGGGLEVGTSGAMEVLEDAWKDTALHAALSAAAALASGWTLWLGLTARPRALRALLAALGAFAVARAALATVDVEPVVRVAIPTLLALQAAAFFALRRAARAALGEAVDPALRG